MLLAATMIGCGSTESNLPTGGGDERHEHREEAAAAQGEGGGASRGMDGDGLADAEQSGASADGAQAAGDTRTVLFIGTSLTAGLGVPQWQSFPLLIGQRIEDAGLPFRVVNAGVSGETSAGALRRIDWLTRQPFDVVVLETGANDMLRGIEPEATERNIQEIIDRLRRVNPDAVIVLAGMLALPNLGEAYAREFEAIYPRLAERNGLPFVPFLLDRVGGDRALNQDDGVHPNAEGHRIIADTVWRVLEPVLVEASGAD